MIYRCTRYLLEQILNQKTIVLYVNLLDEGTPTVRPTEAEILENGLYKLLPTEDYDPEDEIWEFLPGPIVRAIDIQDDKGQPILLAVAL